MKRHSRLVVCFWTAWIDSGLPLRTAITGTTFSSSSSTRRTYPKSAFIPFVLYIWRCMFLEAKAGLHLRICMALRSFVWLPFGLPLDEDMNYQQSLDDGLYWTCMPWATSRWSVQ